MEEPYDSAFVSIQSSDSWSSSIIPKHLTITRKISSLVTGQIPVLGPVQCYSKRVLDIFQPRLFYRDRTTCSSPGHSEKILGCENFPLWVDAEKQQREKCTVFPGDSRKVCICLI